MSHDTPHQHLNQPRQQELLETLKERFEGNMHRHPGLSWGEVESRLLAQPHKLAALYAMEQTGGQPDAVVLEEGQRELIFADCAPESPAGRRSLCYDAAALASRKENKPAHSALGLAEEMGIQVLDEAQYRALQRLFPFDLKTSSWVIAPDHIRRLGGGLFCDRRYDTVFVYHNGAESYYAGRGFRGMLKI